MPRFNRRTLAALGLVLALTLVPAAPLLATPLDAGPASWLAWLADWLLPSQPDGERAAAASEIYPTMDPNGQESTPADPEAPNAASTPSSQGEIHPTMDPNG
jgi:hypothetical protein